ncbi:MAG: H/ACA ribonucleoprotein complex subunit GAR1 [Halanaeroarchaeum sp.]
MRRAGTVVRVAQGLVVCRADDDSRPDIGTRVVDDSLQDVGTVVDVFGPVDRPYLAVDPDDDVHPPAVVGDTLYVR